MSRVLGINFDGERIYAALLRSGYRSLALAGLAKESVSDHDGIEAALARVVAQFGPEPIDHIATALDGRKVFSHRLAIPAAAQKRLDELLGFELEAELPVEIDEVVFDYAQLESDKKAGEPLPVLTLAARTLDVAQELEMFESALDRQPERVLGGGMALEHLPRLYPELKSEEAIVLLNIAHDRGDLCVFLKGRAVAARTLSVKLGQFPDVGPRAIALLKQTFSSLGAQIGRPIARLLVVGPGVRMNGIDSYLESQLGIPSSFLPRPEGLESESPELVERAPEYAVALSIALSNLSTSGFDLRQGPLAFQRGYSHVKRRIPLIGGLVAAVVLSFLFSTWAESQALEAEQGALLESLAEVSKATFGSAAQDADEAETLLSQASSTKPEDPMPYLDGFGVAVVLSEVIPNSIVHDIEDFEVAKGKVKLRGLVNSAEEAQKVAKLFGEHRCIEEAKVNKISQVVNSERERYMLEAEVHCPEDAVVKATGGSR